MGPDGPCFKPGRWHVIWEGLNASIACQTCGQWAKDNKYVYAQMHDLMPACVLPWALWYPDEETCRVPQTDRDFAAGQVLLFR